MDVKKERLSVNVLVVDDEPDILSTLERALKRRVEGVFAASNGKEALDIFKNEKIDIIVTDVDMPVMNGIEMVEYIRQTDKTTPIILATGLKNLDILAEAINLKVHSFLQKPIRLEELYEIIDEITKISSLEKKLVSQHELLEQYKQAVDRSSIVSKTDPKGIITYVNDEFCKISGYEIDELIGKPHNIVRHPDNDKTMYEFMWYMIKQMKQPWSGEIKNRKKDGSSYWVKATISPILDSEGNIVEYIGIRTDITQQETIKHYFEEQYEISNKQFASAFKLSKEYERAIVESNVISRTDPKGKITFVNDKMIELSGYSKDELIGSPHNIVRHPDNPKAIFKELWNTIKSGKVWKGTLKNKNKNGSSYWVNTTIVPILGEDNKVMEYMSIRHNVTELFLLHKEIEDTQREIIYKMGEIGETRSKETGNHVKRVAEYSKLFANLYGLSIEDSDILFAASPMHDIGKVGIPDSILNKPGRLSEEEFNIMKTHSIIGRRILKGSKRPVLQAASIVAYEHHEKWDGSGYPRGVSGEDIHIFGRITAIADVFDALGSDRCYKKAWELDNILELFKKERGKHFDPNLTDIFFENLDSFLEIRDAYKDEE